MIIHPCYLWLCFYSVSLFYFLVRVTHLICVSNIDLFFALILDLLFFTLILLYQEFIYRFVIDIIVELFVIDLIWKFYRMRLSFIRIKLAFTIKLYVIKPRMVVNVGIGLLADTILGFFD